MVNELFPGVFSIDIPLPGNPLKNLNSYLIKGSERNLLIDTGFNMKECLEAMNTGLAELDVDMSKTDIFLTHLHSDHIGLTPSIASDSSRVFISLEDLDLMLQFMTDEYKNEIDQKYLQIGFPYDDLMRNKSLNPAMIYLPSEDVSYTKVSNGQVLNPGGFKLQCILTPGHTPGHMCLYNAEHKILFSGDHVIFGISPNITTWKTLPDPLGAYYTSLRKIEELDVEKTFSAHRQIEGDVKARSRELIHHHDLRLDETMDIVGKIGKSTPYDIASYMKWSIRAKDWTDFPVSQKWFAVGEAYAHLEYLRFRDKLIQTEADGLFYYEIQ